MKTHKIANWGNYPEIDANIFNFSSENELKKIIQESNEIIARGLGRCYGDSALNKNIVSTLKFNRILYFNEIDGTITCESGVSIDELIDIFLPKGWFLPCTPGTKFVTIGGAIASDVHGKNHHIGGSFSNHLISIDLMLSDGSTITCSKNNNKEIFGATCGGMGLTGIILRATFKLSKIETAYIKQEIVKAKNLDEIIDIFEKSKDSTYSVAWIDCLASGTKMGRSIMMKGEHASSTDISGKVYSNNALVLGKKANLSIPFYFPNFVLNTYTVKGFNYLYYNKQLKSVQESFVHLNKFFYPLDSINNWNKIYGSRGFTQYQFVLPKDKSYDGLKKILSKISKSGFGSFLAVLKLFGSQDTLISFPKEGYTLALDFPITPDIFKFLNELDDIVLENGGRLYLTKDVRMSRQTFEKGYENSTIFKEIKHKVDKENKFQSLQSKRISI